MTRDEILAAFDRIRVWQQGDLKAATRIARVYSLTPVAA